MLVVALGYAQCENLKVASLHGMTAHLASEMGWQHLQAAYQDSCFCLMPAARKAPGCPVESAANLITLWGIVEATRHARAAPKSCPIK